VEGPPERPDSNAGGTAATDPGTVEELVAEARFHAEFEESRFQANNQRAAWLLALNGVILSLVANQAREMLTDSRLLGSTGKWIAAISLAAAVLLVLASAGCALMVILRVNSWGWCIEEIEKMPGDEYTARGKTETQGTFLAGLVERIKAERKDYPQQRNWLNGAFATLGVALVAIVLHIGVYSVQTLDGPACPYKAGGGSAPASSISEEDGAGGGPTGFVATVSHEADVPAAFEPPPGGPCPR
jgi:hypothetical protein